MEREKLTRLHRCAQRGFGELKICYKKPEAFLADLGELLALLDDREETIRRQRGQMNEMRNAMPEIMAEFSALQKKFAFTFRSEQPAT